MPSIGLDSSAKLMACDLVHSDECAFTVAGEIFLHVIICIPPG